MTRFNVLFDFPGSVTENVKTCADFLSHFTTTGHEGTPVDLSFRASSSYISVGNRTPAQMASDMVSAGGCRGVQVTFNL